MDGRWDVSLHDLRAVYDPEMHIAMLQDSSRHRFYAQCLLKHQDDFKDKVAVDIGAGVGIMSALAVVHGKLGHVHAVEVLPEVARIIPKVLEAALDEEERSKITVHCGFAEQFCATPGWPADEVALVVSEWLGILALNEGMAQPLLRCRDALCRGRTPFRMLPGWLRLWVQPGRAQQGAACGPRAISSDQLEGSAKVLLDLDLNTCSFSDLFENPGIDLESCEVPTAATGLVGWFDLHCCKDHPEVKMSTSPSAPKTHWLQCWMPFQKALNGESKCGKLHVKVQLRPQKLAGLPELCVALSGAQQALYFLDRGIVEYGDVPTFATEEPDFKRQRRAEDIEAIYFPSDVQELVRLAQQAVQEGAGPDA